MASALVCLKCAEKSGVWDGPAFPTEKWEADIGRPETVMPPVPLSTSSQLGRPGPHDRRRLPGRLI